MNVNMRFICIFWVKLFRQKKPNFLCFFRFEKSSVRWKTSRVSKSEKKYKCEHSCCDRKSWAACAQSFAPRQQATIEITRRDHSVIACSRHTHIFLFFAHIPFVVNHTINATPPERLQHSQILKSENTKNSKPCSWSTLLWM